MLEINELKKKIADKTNNVISNKFYTREHSSIIDFDEIAK